MDQITEVTYYWRPGCPFCARLEQTMTQANVPMTKRNIWDDPSAAAFVRSVADGNETVPTVTIGDESWVNPSPKDLTKLLEERAPHLLRQ